MEMWSWPQWSMVALAATSLLITANQHGKPKTGKTSFWVTATAITIEMTLMYFGGFWS